MRKQSNERIDTSHVCMLNMTLELETHVPPQLAGHVLDGFLVGYFLWATQLNTNQLNGPVPSKVITSGFNLKLLSQSKYFPTDRCFLRGYAVGL